MLTLHVFNETWTKSCQNSVIGFCENRDLSVEWHIKVSFHGVKVGVHSLVEEDSDSNEHHRDNDSKYHLVRLSLLDTLFPNVVLHTCLLGTSCVTKVDYILEESLIDALEGHRVHLEDCLEGLTHTEGRLTDRVLSFVYQVEYLYDDWMLKQLLHVHLIHDIKTVFFLGHVENWFTHKLV